MARRRAPLLRRGRDPSAGLVPGRADDRPTGRRAAVGTGDRDRVRERSGGDDGRPGRRDGQGGPAGDLPERVAGRRRRQPRRTDLPRPVAVPSELGSGGRASHQQRAAPCRPDRVERGHRDPLDGADPGRCRGGVRRRPQRLRVDAGDDRGRRRRRALRGPAREREEVRAPRRQGAGADGPVHPHAHRGPAGRRRGRRADARGRAHRRARRDAAHERHRPARPAVREG